MIAKNVEYKFLNPIPEDALAFGLLHSPEATPLWATMKQYSDIAIIMFIIPACNRSQVFETEQIESIVGNRSTAPMGNCQ